jgi:hypothetical protein
MRCGAEEEAVYIADDPYDQPIGAESEEDVHVQSSGNKSIATKVGAKQNKLSYVHR